MAKAILYGTLRSPPVRCVLLTSKAIGVDLDYREVNVTNREQLSENFLKKNPQHTVPTLEIGGDFIWDSHAISTYLISKFAKDDSLYPKDLLTRAKVDQRLHFDSGVLFSALRDIIIRVVRMRVLNYDPIFRDRITEGYEFLEQFLSSTPYLVGNTLTVADLSCISTISTSHLFVPVDAAKYPRLDEWINRISKMPYYGVNQEGIDVFSKLLDSIPGWKK